MIQGMGLGWRRALAHYVAQRPGLSFVEVLAEDLQPDRIPRVLEALVERGTKIVVHGVSLSLGSAEGPNRAALDHLARIAERLSAPLVSEHVCFTRAGGLESGHLLPLPRSREALEILIENVREAKRALPVPLALENIASLIEWPDAELSEGAFLGTLLRETDTALLLDVSNLYAHTVNFGLKVDAFLNELPLQRIAYLHAAGGVRRGALYHDTHAHPLPDGPLEVLRAVAQKTKVPALMLERDDRFPPSAELDAELHALASAAALDWEAPRELARAG